MAPKKITGYVKLQVMAGKATPAPRLAPRSVRRGQHHGVLQTVNDRTKDPAMAGLTIPVVITVYGGSYIYLHHEDPTAPVAPVESCRNRKGFGHAEQGQGRQGDEKQVREIATQKMPDLNALQSMRSEDQIRHLLDCDLANLLLGHLPTLSLFGVPNPLRFLQLSTGDRSRWGLRDEGKCTIAYTVITTGIVRPSHRRILRTIVELFAELHDVDLRLTSAGQSAVLVWPCGHHLQLHISSDSFFGAIDTILFGSRFPP